MFFCQDRRSNVAFKNWISWFSMFVPTKDTMKIANGNIVQSKGIGMIYWHFTNCSIIYPVGPVYYCPRHSPNTISPVALNVYVGSQKVASEPLEYCDFFDLHGCSWVSHEHTHNNLYYLQIYLVKVNPQRNRNIFPSVCSLSKQILSQLIHQRFGHVSIARPQSMARQWLMESLPTNIPDLEEPFPIYLLTK